MMLVTACLLLPLTVPAVTDAARPELDEAPALLAERARRVVEEPRAPRIPGRAGAGSRFFFKTGPDNAPCIRAVPDVTGDGRDEVIAGIDESGTNNLFALDGASAGAATVTWSLQTVDGVSGGSPYGDQCIVPISDSDGNGAANLLLGTAWGGRTAYNIDSQSGAIRWKLDTYLTAASGWIYSLAEMSDVSGDGVPECAFGSGSDSDSVYFVNGADVAGAQATVLWRWAAGDAVYSVRNLGDVNGDGDDDVLAAVGDNVDEIVCLDGGTTNPAGNVLWTYDPGTSVYAVGVLPDITGDGIAEALAVLWASGGSSIRCLNGTTGAVVWSSTAVPDYGMMVDVLEDVTGDGYAEVIVASWGNAAIVLDGFDGSLVWKRTVGTTNGGDVWTVAAIDDLNGDGRQDVIAGSFDEHVYALDGDTGEVFWAYFTDNRLYSVCAVGDLDGDGTPEVGAATQDTSNSRVIHVLDGNADLPDPNLTLTGPGTLGSLLTIEVIGNPGAFAIPAASGTTASTSLPPFGILGLGFPLVMLPSGPLDGTGVFTTSTTIPTDPVLAGMTFWVQAAVATFGPLAGDFTDVESIVLN